MTQKPQYRFLADLPPGWINVQKGSKNPDGSTGYTYTDRTGATVHSNERHAYNVLSGETMSVRQYQTLQRKNREARGAPKPAPVQRTGKIRTRYGPSSGKGGDFYDPRLHGDTQVFIFRDIDTARVFAALDNTIPDKYNLFLIQIRYTQRLQPGKENSDTRARNGYATLSAYVTRDEFQLAAALSGPIRGVPNVWDEAETLLQQNFDMTGERARVYIYAAEK